jgi:F0F1-type ATP synthase assembly protein I
MLMPPAEPTSERQDTEPPSLKSSSIEPPDGDSKETFWILVGRYSQLAFVLPAALVVGWLLGTALDHWLHTTWLYLLGIILGIAAGFIELIRTALRDSK